MTVLRAAALTLLAMTLASAQVQAQALAGDATRSPESLVHAFMADYLAWNDRAHRETERAPEDQDLERAEAEYEALLRRYCRPGFAGQLIAFGSESMHDPAREQIVGVTTRGDTTVVTTRHTNPTGGFAAEFEYYLLSQDGRWYLEQVYYVSDDGKHPTL